MVKALQIQVTEKLQTWHAFVFDNEIFALIQILTCRGFLKKSFFRQILKAQAQYVFSAVRQIARYRAKQHRLRSEVVYDRP